MITRDEILMGRDKAFPLNPEQENSLYILTTRLNKFRAIYGKSMVISSGYRPAGINARVGGATNSAHIACQACDFRDVNGDIRKFIQENPSVLEACDLYCEDFKHTPTWVHLQTRRTRSGKRIFKP